MNIEELRTKQAEFEGNRTELKTKFSKLEKLRKQFVSAFKPQTLKSLPIEKYIVGQGRDDTFCL